MILLGLSGFGSFILLGMGDQQAEEGAALWVPVTPATSSWAEA